jgi:hypothetical protein
MSYLVTSRAYLARAKRRLKDQTLEGLFYAAFELRCCVETRQEEYATALEFLKTKVKPWKIGKTAMTLERIFESKKIAHIILSFDGSEKFDLYYTPVSKRLYGAAERLGLLLHRMKTFKEDSDSFWETIRTKLQNIYRDAWLACQGTLLTPPFMEHPLKVEDPSEDLAEWLIRAGREHLNGTITVEYLNHPPSGWTCDLFDAGTLASNSSSRPRSIRPRYSAKSRLLPTSAPTRNREPSSRRPKK